MTYESDPESVEKLLAIMRLLRDPDQGCPWDQKQTFHTIAPYTIEEAYEVNDAIQRNDMQDLRDELGDLMLQVVFHAQIASEQQYFDFNDVVASICRKMIRRHPHVFDKAAATEATSGTASWEEMKDQERLQKCEGIKDNSLLAAVAPHLPPLQRALKLQKKAAQVHFDWQDVNDVFAKMKEEMQELDHAVHKEQSCERISDEFGDALFTLLNLSRHLQVNPEQCLYQANQKFERRFRNMEQLAADQSHDLSELSAKEWDVLWRQSKDGA